MSDLDTLARDYWRDDGNPLPDDWQGRAELAESILMGLAFEHGRGMRLIQTGDWRPPCVGLCPLCESTRADGPEVSW